MLINKSNTIFYVKYIIVFKVTFFQFFFQESALSKGGTFNLHLIDDKSENLVAALQKKE